MSLLWLSSAAGIDCWACSHNPSRLVVDCQCSVTQRLSNAWAIGKKQCRISPPLADSNSPLTTPRCPSVCSFVRSSVCRLKCILVGHWPDWPSSATVLLLLLLLLAYYKCQNYSAAITQLGGTSQNLYLKRLHSSTWTSADGLSGPRQVSRMTDEKGETWSPFGMTKVRSRPERPQRILMADGAYRIGHLDHTVTVATCTGKQLHISLWNIHDRSAIVLGSCC